MIPKLNGWQITTLLCVFLLSVAGLGILGKDTGAFIALGLGVLGAIGIAVGQNASNGAKVDAVQVQTNGNTTAMLRLLGELAHRLGDAPAIPRQPTPATAVDGLPVPDTPAPSVEPTEVQPVSF